MEDEEKPGLKKSQAIGQNLDNLSIDELRDFVNNLRNEITRVELLIKEKTKAKTLADKFFK
ncbi:MAG: hypothetical protein CFH32_00977 [Alphaproteobacteria bacterium MarineAlpha9_Bin2]|nr:MAG: hypothetical protein CFH31_00966 [Alphaproteobacteria bacterium MarineAlpha9_Bin1]PPR29930.1 MAG: hypothetical protein CFH32_00977 [Alphaproteobacteria bacterium MarineAlpha9_Bin2]